MKIYHYADELDNKRTVYDSSDVAAEDCTGACIVAGEMPRNLLNRTTGIGNYAFLEKSNLEVSFIPFTKGGNA